MDDLKFEVWMAREQDDILVAAFVACFDARDFVDQVNAVAAPDVSYYMKEC